MTSRELEIINIVYETGGKCSVRTISKRTNLSSDYTYYLSQTLLKQELIKQADNTLILTDKGKSFIAPFRNDLEQETKFLGVSPYLDKDQAELSSFKTKAKLMIPEFQKFQDKTSELPRSKKEEKALSAVSQNNTAFISGRKFNVEQPQFIRYNFNTNQMVEKADGRSIEDNIQRLTSVKPVGDKTRVAAIYAAEPKRESGISLKHKRKARKND